MEKIMKCSRALILSLSCFVSIQSYAQHETIPLLGGRKSEVAELKDILIDTYRIGDEWGKKAVTADAMGRSVVLNRGAKATANIRGATGFYLGQYAGEYVVGTNHHVCPKKANCEGLTIKFPFLEKSFKVVKVLGTWPAVDFALLTLKVVNPEDAKVLNAVAGPLAFDERLFRGKELMTIGFGVANNPRGQMMVNEDSDCKVFSNDDSRLMADPDELNPGEYKAWSFSHGCDISHGDSGSAMLDRQTGAVLGIVWTGKIPKSKKVQKSAYLDNLLKNPTEEIWTEMSYSVPASKMRDYWNQLLSSTTQTLDADTSKVLKAILK